MFRTRIAAIGAALAVAVAALVGLTATPAAATLPACVNHVTHYATWGSIRVCIKNYTDTAGQKYYTVDLRTDDTLTDGYCVHAELHVRTFWITPGEGELITPDTSESCGPVQDTGLFAISGDLDEIRLVRGPSSDDGVGAGYLSAWPD